MKTVPLESLFDIAYGQSLELNRLIQLERGEGGVAFVSRKMGDNGIAAYVASIPGVTPSPPGLLTCALGGAVMSTFLQQEPFYSGRDVAHLHPKLSMSEQQLLFYCYCLSSNRYRFSYGRQANRTLKTIRVPMLDAIPDYALRADVHRYDHAPRAANSVAPALRLHKTWKSFELQALFDIYKGQRLTKADMLPGTTPYVGASDSNNGVTAYIGQTPIHDSGTISVSYNGSVAEAFYQSAPYWATDDVNVLYPKGFKLSPAAALFVCAIIRLEKYRFNYGRKWNLERMRASTIKLPALPDGAPDWPYMEHYVCTLPYSSQL